MNRRKFLRSTGLAAGAAAAIATPAIAQSNPRINWRLASSYPKSLDTLYGCSPQIAKRVAEATDGQFQIQPFAAGEIVPALQVMDAVQNGTVECGHTLSNFYIGKDPAFVFDSVLPFGLNARQQNAWLHQGGGLELIREFMKPYNIHTIPAGNTGAQMGGWFRKEIKSVADLSGLKFRVAGLAGQILSRLGVVPQQIAGGDIYPALERGTIDAAEFSGPHDDEKLGFQKVAKYYYYPGWWEGQTQSSVYVNLEQWNKLPKSYQAIVTSAAADTYTWMIGKYDTDNVAALRRLVAAGTELRPFSREILDAAYKASQEVYADFTAKNPKWKAVYEPWKAFMEDQHQWFRVNELQFDTYMMTVKKS